MASDAWYLHKKDKYYGPFSFEKVKRFAEDGKIGPQTRIAEDPEGKTAATITDVAIFRRAFAELWQLPALPEAPAAVVEKAAKPEAQAAVMPTPVTKASAEAKAAPVASAANGARSAVEVATPQPGPLDVVVRELWTLYSPTGIEIGQFPREWFKEALTTGEVEATAWVQKVGAANRVTLSSLFPEFAPKKMNIEPPKSFQDRASSRPVKPAIANRKRKRLSPKASVALGVSVLLFAGLGFWLFYKPSGGEKPINQVRKTLSNQSALRKQISNFTKPPFNLLVDNAVTKGLNFTFPQIQEFHKGDNLLYNSNQAKNYGKLFVHRVFREFSVLTSGGYKYTYLFDEKNYVFAVVISGSNFDLIEIDKLAPTDFAQKVKSDSRDKRILWETQLAEGIVARLEFADKGMGHMLDALVVYDSITANEKVQF